MYEKFMQELKDALARHNIESPDDVIAAYKEKYDKLISIGKSEFEAIMALGEPEEIACNIQGKRSSTLQKLERNLIVGATPKEPQKQEPADATEELWSPEKDKKVPTKPMIYLTDIVYLLPSLLISAFGIIATAFVGALIGAAGCKYIVVAWTQFQTIGSKITAFVLALCAIAMCAGALYLCYWLGKVIYKGVKDYLKIRSSKLKYINSIQS